MLRQVSYFKVPHLANCTAATISKENIEAILSSATFNTLSVPNAIEAIRKYRLTYKKTKNEW